MKCKLIKPDGEQVEVRMIEEIEKARVKGTGWGNTAEMNTGDCYRFIDEGGVLDYEEFSNIRSDKLFFERANFFEFSKDGEELAENIARAQNLWRNLQRWQALNDEPINWKNDKRKYFIIYDYETQRLYIDTKVDFSMFMGVFFNTEEICQKAIETFKDELLWFFNEFRNRMDF